jgi:PAS domain S-box-containing protein
MSPDEESTVENRVLPVIADAGNRRLLAEWLDDHSTYEHVEFTGNFDEATFDVCILDRGAFETHLDVLREQKTAAAPVLLPYLLLLPESGAEIIGTDAGQLVDNVVTETVDELVTLPIQRAELHWRLSALLRLREQSLTLRNRERELERRVDLFEKVQAIADVGGWEYDVDTGITWWSDEVRRIYGLSEGETLSPEAGLQNYHPEDRERVTEAFEAAVESGDPYDIEVRFVDEDDNHGWVQTRGEPQYEDGELTRVRGTIQDITERKERERELQRIQEAVEASGHAIYITDTGGEIRYVNPAFEAITGFAESEIIGETPRVLDSDEMSDEYFDNLWDTLRSGEVWEEEIINQRKSGETYPAMQTIAPVTDGEEMHAFVAVHDDITERKERERELQRRTRAIDEAPVGISISDPAQADNPMIYVNDAFVEMTGYPREEALGDNCRFLQGEHTDPEQVARIRKAIDAQEPIAIDIRNYRRDGTEFWNHLEIAPVRDSDGAVINWIGFQQDITERKERQQQLEILDRVLRHNIRNDMNVIRGQADIIQARASGDAVAAAEQIADTSDQLMGMADKEREITELLREEPTHEEIELRPLLQHIASTASADHPNATVAVDCPEETTVHATTQFAEVLGELVTNAITHDDASPAVDITVTRTDGTVRIEVADTGPRIPEMERELLEGLTNQTPLYHGSGLGLWMVRLIVSRSGGTIACAENEPAGNVVSIELPD